MLHFRQLTPEDEPLLWPMLAIAAHETHVETVVAQPALARYVAGWGRDGDSGVAAFESNSIIGAAWLRLWNGGERGFGFLDESTPELAMAVAEEYRGQGVGTRLMNEIFSTARERYTRISLNVREDNQALRLYERAGFVRVPGSEIVNRTGGISFTMCCDW